MKFLTSLFFLVYQLVFMPITLALALTVGLFNQKIRSGVQDRLKLRKTRRALKERPIWIHASSGEFEYAKSIIRELKNDHPNVPVVVTYFSPSYKKHIVSFPGVDQAEPLPLDLPGPVFDFLKFYRPRLALFARTDLWPEVLRQTKRRRIPSLLFSCTRTPLKGTRYLSRIFYSLFYSLLDQIHCVTKVDQVNLSALTNTPITVSGDTRYDQVAFRLNQGRDFSTQILPTTMPRFIAGSTWPEDEAIILPALTPFLRAQKAQLILVPHEPSASHLKLIQDNLRGLGLSHTLLSQATTWSGAEVLIVDQVGLLADLYAYADYAIIGGSFKAKVHSVMEALGAGLPVIVGPFYENNREATEFKKINVGDGDGRNHLTAVQSVADLAQMQNAVKLLAGLSSQERKQIKTQLAHEFKIRQGASAHVVAWIKQRLDAESLQ
jgi:3-deoxy-D-manno-octulosonic-acid transferase